MRALKLTLVLAVSAALLPAVQARADVPTPLFNFCSDFNKIITNDLLSGLGDDVANFIGIFDPNKADINGEFRIDDSGDSLVIEVFGNGVLDATNEFGLMQFIMNNPSLFTGPDNPLVITHDDVHEAFKANRNMLRNKYFGGALAGLIDVLLEGITNVLTAYITLGDGDFLVESRPTPGNPDAPIVVSGEGSFGFAGAFVAVVDYFVRQELGIGFQNSNLDPEDFIFMPELRPDGDVDGDGFSNLCEYRGFPPTQCGDNPEIHYVVAALDPDIQPVGCYETIFDCITDLETDQAVPLFEGDTTGNARFQIWENTVTGNQRYILNAFHTSTNQLLNFGIFAEGPGANGPRIVNMGTGALPVAAEISAEQFLMMQIEPTYFALQTRANDEAPRVEEVRGAFECEIPPYDGPEVFTCKSFLSSSNLAEPFENPRIGSANIHYRPEDGLLFGTVSTDIFAGVSAFIGAGGPGEEDGVILDLGTITSNAAHFFAANIDQATAQAIFSGEAYVQVNSTPFPNGHLRGQLACAELPFDEEGEGEGEGEGLPEGEGEGEGDGEGLPEGEGEGDGEGLPEGEGEGDGEGLPEGEGEGGVPGEFFTHTSDQNNDGRINLSEALRVIQIYNVGAYHCQDGTEDGYATGTGDQSCTPHSSDYAPQNWVIGFSELLRLIQFFNIGGYHACPDRVPPTEDGYCVGPPPGA